MEEKRNIYRETITPTKVVWWWWWGGGGEDTGREHKNIMNKIYTRRDHRFLKIK